MDKEKAQSKILIKAGSLVSGLGALTTAEAIVFQRGEMGPVGIFIIGVGVVGVLTGIRKRGKI